MTSKRQDRGEPSSRRARVRTVDSNFANLRLLNKEFGVKSLWGGRRCDKAIGDRGRRKDKPRRKSAWVKKLAILQTQKCFLQTSIKGGEETARKVGKNVERGAFHLKRTKQDTGHTTKPFASLGRQEALANLSEGRKKNLKHRDTLRFCN